MSADLALLRFPNSRGAGQAFADMRERPVPRRGWTRPPSSSTAGPGAWSDAMAALETVLVEAPRVSRDQTRTSG
jgi:hypothetical protein